MTETMPPSGRLFGRRKGRPLRVRKTHLMKELLPKIEITLPLSGVFSPAALFPNPPRDFVLEIGFGGGEHLAGMAKRDPVGGYIGCEPFLNGIASLLDHLDREQINNVRIYGNDARHLLDALPPASIKDIYILFADPWPKARHAERRFVGPENLPRISRALMPNGTLHLATDDTGLAAWMLEHMRAAKDFTETYLSSRPPPHWIPTRYEQKALVAGRQPVYSAYRRV